MSACDLTNKNCVPCEGGIARFTAQEAKNYLSNITAWNLNADATAITKKFEFKGFNKTMSFINAVAWIVNNENHHPDIKFGFNYCEITFTTHAINGLSENDFICAAKIDRLLE